MDNLGYKNWGTSPVVDGDEGYDLETDSPSYYDYKSNRSRFDSKKHHRASLSSSEYEYGSMSNVLSSPDVDHNRKASNRADQKKDQYDFEISNDDDDMYVSRTKADYERGAGRRSVDDRAKDILERNRAKSKSVDAASDVQLNNALASYESTLNDLMEGITIPKADVDLAATGTSAFSEDSIGEHSRMKTNDTNDSALMDSCEISMADLEVQRSQ